MKPKRYNYSKNSKNNSNLEKDETDIVHKIICLFSETIIEGKNDNPKILSENIRRESTKLAEKINTQLVRKNAAINMLKKGTYISVISKATGLNGREIAILRNNIKIKNSY